MDCVARLELELNCSIALWCLEPSAVYVLCVLLTIRYGVEEAEA